MWQNTAITFKIDIHSPKVSTAAQSVLVHSRNLAQLNNLCSHTAQKLAQLHNLY